MGFIKTIASKATGADVQADVAERNGNAQAEATRTAADLASKNTQEATAQAARLQEQAAARSAAQAVASDSMNKPLETAEIAVTPQTNESAVAAARKRRQTFGIGSANTGVNI